MKNIFTLFLFGLLYINNVYSQTFTSTTNVTIPDAGAQVCSGIAVTGVGTIDGTYGLTSVCIKINHTYDGDLDIFLVAPDGTPIELSTDNGGGGNNYGDGAANNGGTPTCFEMTASALITSGSAPFQNTYIPEGNLSDANNGQNANGTWNLCVTDDSGGDTGFINAWQLTFDTPPAPPINDDCGNAILLTVNADENCTTTTSGTVFLATGSSDANSCGATIDDDDVWFSFVALNSTHYIDLTNISGSFTNLYLSVYTGTCGSLGNAILCSNADLGSTLTSLTPGTTYYVRVYTNTTTGGQNTDFDICVYSDPPPISTCTGNYYDSGGAGGQYSDSELIEQTYCSDAGNCIQIDFNSFNTESGYDYLDIYDGPNTSSTLIGSYSGTSLPNGGTITSSTGCLTFVFDSDGSSVRDGWDASISCVACPTPPTNDDCGSATALTVNTDENCTTTTSATLNLATASSDANSCGATIDDDDVWFSFVAVNSTHYIDLTNITGSFTNLYLSVYTGTCGSLGNAILCSNDDLGSTLTSLTPGTTYYVRVYTNTTTGGQNTDFDICVYSDPPPISTCTGNYYDSGGSGGQYSDSELIEQTYCSDAGNCIQIDFNSFNTESGYDYLDIYDGPNTSSPLIGSYSGTSLPNGGTISSSTGCLTFVFDSDGSSVRDGWDASISCVACPTPPTNDDCANATLATVNPDENCTSTTPGTVLLASGSTDANSCGATRDDDDVWFEFVATNTTHYIDLLNISGSTVDLYHSVFEGTCGSLGNAILCSDPNSSTLNGLTIGNTYYVRVYTYTSTSGQNTTFDLCVTSPQPPPVNDECSTPTVVTVNNDETCTFTTAGTIHGATGSSDGNTCFGTDDDDVWFSFVALNATHYIDLLNVTGSVTDMYHVLYSGSCGSLNQIYCSDANSSTASGLTIGATYYIRVYTYTSSGGQDTDFDVCISSDPPPVTACSGNFYDTGGSGSNYSNNENYFKTYCSSTPGQCLVMTFTSFNTESCCDELTIYNGPDLSSPVIGTYAGSSLPNGGVITANSGCLTIYWDSDYSSTSAGWEATISCGACPAPTCSDGIQNGTETGIDCGGTCGACPVCGNPTTNDWCSDPAILTQGGSGWTSSTYNYYTYDDPGTSFCGSIENNSWYLFTAASTTETFNFTSIDNCSWNDGIQAEVFDVTTDANGCCTSLSSVSNCWNPGYVTSGTVTATGLTIGNDYYLMVDGYAGDYCEFTVSNWSATGILPVTLTNFKGHNYKGGNKLIWTTQSEVNNDYFIIQRAKDAKNFDDVGIVDGNGNSNIENNYEFIDDESLSGINYYRLKQIDFNGDYEHSRIIVLKSINSIDVAIYPNPSADNLYFDLSDSNDEVLTISYTNMTGITLKEKIQTSKEMNTYKVNEFKKLSSGIYMMQILNEKNEIIKYQKIVKK
ncbi:T9SS type A sorting domain-containing protein [Vicingus serpentipes]|uniref:T9SS type A sorting domain-containing protein n=1 Tax=Vicingus serpentipes TaxID=1926625 RepID=A0A5C6RUM6_9FLAO|nr:CUB domain-containing protein [Vicingus serpentipes]TXB65777.1 T9SS type A sorting domain-containing protein [Vicingus serpentipes]